MTRAQACHVLLVVVRGRKEEKRFSEEDFWTKIMNVPTRTGTEGGQNEVKQARACTAKGTAVPYLDVGSRLSCVVLCCVNRPASTLGWVRR